MVCLYQSREEKSNDSFFSMQKGLDLFPDIGRKWRGGARDKPLEASSCGWMSSAGRGALEGFMGMLLFLGMKKAIPGNMV